MTFNLINSAHVECISQLVLKNEGVPLLLNDRSIPNVSSASSISLFLNSLDLYGTIRADLNYI